MISLLTCLTGWGCWEYCRGTPQRLCWRWGLRWSRTSTAFYQRRWQDWGHRRWKISVLVIKYLQGIVFKFIPRPTLNGLIGVIYIKPTINFIAKSLEASRVLHFFFPLVKLQSSGLSLVSSWSESFQPSTNNDRENFSRNMRSSQTLDTPPTGCTEKYL